MSVQIRANIIGGTHIRFCTLESAFKGIPEMIKVNTCVIQPCRRNQKSASFVVPGR